MLLFFMDEGQYTIKKNILLSYIVFIFIFQIFRSFIFQIFMATLLYLIADMFSRS